MNAFFCKHKLLASVLITTVQFFGVFLVLSFLFHSDEYHAELSLSGDYFGAYATQYPFIHAGLSRVLILLYRVCGSVPWYSVMDLACLFASFAAIHYALLCVLAAKKWPLPLIEAIHAAVFCIALLPCLSGISFTFVAGFLGIAGVCLLFVETLQKEHKRRIRVVSIVYLLASFCLRRYSGLVVACFYLLTLFVVDQVKKDESLKGVRGLLKGFVPSLLTAAILLASFGGLSVINRAMRSTPDGQAVLSWNEDRSALFDYYDESRYEDDQAFFESVGYHEAAFHLAKRAWFIGEKGDAARLSQIAAYLKETTPENNLSQTVAVLVDGVAEHINDRKMVPLFMGCVLLLAAIVIRVPGRKTPARAWWAFEACAAVFGTVLLCLYLCYVGRFLYHVFRLCVCPAFFCLLFTAAVLAPQRQVREEESVPNGSAGLTVAAVLVPLAVLCVLHRHFESGLFYGLCVLALTAVIGVCAWASFRNGKKRFLLSALCGTAALVVALASCLSVRTVCFGANSYEKEQPEMATAHAYIRSHPQNVWISSFPGKIDIRHYVTDSESLLPCFYTFDYVQPSEVYRHKLAVNGRTSISVSALLEDNVYLIGGEIFVSQRLLTWIEEDLSHETGKTVRATVVESLENGVKVYRFAVA